MPNAARGSARHAPGDRLPTRFRARSNRRRRQCPSTVRCQGAVVPAGEEEGDGEARDRGGAGSGRGGWGIGGPGSGGLGFGSGGLVMRRAQVVYSCKSQHRRWYPSARKVPAIEPTSTCSVVECVATTTEHRARSVSRNAPRFERIQRRPPSTRALLTSATKDPASVVSVSARGKASGM